MKELESIEEENIVAHLNLIIINIIITWRKTKEGTEG
jgi:hypothetical protein